jgi:hypothetical protein
MAGIPQNFENRPVLLKGQRIERMPDLLRRERIRRTSKRQAKSNEQNADLHIGLQVTAVYQMKRPEPDVRELRSRLTF